nr:hypothetical protein [Tanacetum cinerariifolium]
MTPAQALTIIQTMADHSQKWHGSSYCRNIDSSSNTKGIIAIVSKLDSLGQDMKKLNENVHAIQVGCQLCGGAHLDKECPLNEEVKSVEEVKYGEFGLPLSAMELNVMLEENERQESGLDIKEYDPPEVHVETFEVKRFREMIRKELDTRRKVQRKT